MYNDSFFTILIVSLKFRNNSRIMETSPGSLLWKIWIMWIFGILCYLLIFLEVVLQGIAKSNPTE